MNSRIYRLLVENQGRDIDDAFINEAFEIMMSDDSSLLPFINDFKIVDKLEENSLGTYNPFEKKMTINKTNILNPNICDDIPNKRMLVLRTLRHEIEHARNTQRLHQCRTDIESMVIRLSMKDYALENGLDRMDPFDKEDFFSLMYRARKKEHYLIDPEERLADIRAWKYLVNLLKNQRTSQDLLVARSNLYYSFIRGYKDNGYYLDAPTYQFLLKMGMYHRFYILKKQIEELEHYSFESRLMYGLPLSQEEYERDVLRKVKLRIKKKDENSRVPR